MKKLKIAIVTNNYTPYCGGLVSSINSFANQLIQFGHEVLIITLDFLGNKNNTETNVKRIYCPIRFMYKKNHMAIPWEYEKSVFNLLEEFSPDIIHSQHPFLLGVAALKASKILSIPIIFTYHTKYEDYSHYVPLPEIISKPIIKQLALSYSNSVDGIIAPSKSILDYLHNNNVFKKTEVIPSGIQKVYLQESLSLKVNKKFELLTVSRFVKEKNIEFLLEIFSKLDQSKFKLTLIGFGSHLDFLRDYTFKKLKISTENVKFIIKPSKDLISEYYKKSDLFIFSSFSETQGLVLAEAMSGGCPVVALNASGVCDIIKNEFNGFLVNSNYEMIDKINFLSNNSSFYIEMQKNAWQSSKDYSTEKLTNKLIDFYFSFIK